MSSQHNPRSKKAKLDAEVAAKEENKDESCDSESEMETEEVTTSSLASPKRASSSSSSSSSSKIKNPKIRQHVNPLSDFFKQKIDLPEDWIERTYANPSLPFIVDIGCARGRWIADSATKDKKTNYLGLEIRSPLIDYALAIAAEAGLTENTHYIFCNVNVNLERLLADIKRVSRLSFVCVQFPDPLFKKRLKKRRVFTNEVLQTIATYSDADTRLFVQSDVVTILEEVLETIDETNVFRDCDVTDRATLKTNKSPMEFQTEREKYVLDDDLPVYRMLFQLK